MKIVGIIPARYKSSRFPGKPLADICGKPMVWWVYKQVKEVREINESYVATDDERIEKACKQYDIPVIMTSDKHPTGTDRVAEVAQKIDADLYCVIMGDEPLIESDDIRELINKAAANPDSSATMLICKYSNPVDVVNTTTIKVAVNRTGRVIYMSRSPIPYPKTALDFCYYKNIGVYIFKKDILEFYTKESVGLLEKAEEIELLRLLENGKYVDSVEVSSGSVSVDTQKDLERVQNVLKDKVKL